MEGVRLRWKKFLAHCSTSRVALLPVRHREYNFKADEQWKFTYRFDEPVFRDLPMQRRPLIIEGDPELAERLAHSGLVIMHMSVLLTSSKAASTPPDTPCHEKYHDLRQCVSRVTRLDAYGLFKIETTQGREYLTILLSFL